MPTLTGAWSRDEVDDFLTEATIPLRLACHTPAGELWMLSLWYLWREGSLHCATSASADVVRYLDADPRVAFEVSTNEVPYRGVRGRGEAELALDADKELLETLLERYLGGTDSPLARRLLSPDREEVRLTIDPDRIYSWDYSSRMRGVESTAED